MFFFHSSFINSLYLYLYQHVTFITKLMTLERFWQNKCHWIYMSWLRWFYICIKFHQNFIIYRKYEVTYLNIFVKKCVWNLWAIYLWKTISKKVLILVTLLSNTVIYISWIFYDIQNFKCNNKEYYTEMHNFNIYLIV